MLVDWLAGRIASLLDHLNQTTGMSNRLCSTAAFCSSLNWDHWHVTGLQEHRASFNMLGMHVLAAQVPVTCPPQGLWLQVHVSKDSMSNTNNLVRSRQLWGNEVYTQDSDLLAVLMHQGFFNQQVRWCTAADCSKAVPCLIRTSLSWVHCPDGHEKTARLLRQWSVVRQSGCNSMLRHC